MNIHTALANFSLGFTSKKSPASSACLMINRVQRGDFLKNVGGSVGDKRRHGVYISTNFYYGPDDIR